MITVVCPVFNESKYIAGLLEFCINGLPAEKEIIIIDGNSTDDTCAIVETFQKKQVNIQLLHNPKRIVPFALNMAIKKAKGDVIVRLDAHTLYDENYFLKVLEAFDKSGADIVGGPMRIAAGTALQDAVGYATSTSFGIGNSSFHFDNFEGFTDSVYLGAWKKNIFETTGLFDEALKRNQDDEFHYRAKNLGFKIYQSPQIKSYYYPRNSYATLFKQYYQYGFYKPLVLAKVRSGLRFRHLVPLLFVLYLISLPLFILFKYWLMLFPLALYFLLNFTYSFRSKKSILQVGRISIAYFMLHVSYGSGFILGAINMLFRKNNKQ